MTDEPHTTQQILSALSSGTHMSEAMREQVAEIVGGSVWKTMDSAPKDGTRIILAWEGKMREGYWLDNSKSRMPWSGWKLVAMDPWPKSQPTHWQHLPAPPDSTT